MDLFAGHEDDFGAVASPEPLSTDITDIDENAAVAKVSDLLALAEAAAAGGRDAFAEYLMYRAERMALESGHLFLLHLVWEQSPR